MVVRAIVRDYFILLNLVLGHTAAKNVLHLSEDSFFLLLVVVDTFYHLFCRPSDAIDCFERNYQELNQELHVCFIFDNQVQVSCISRYRDALPAEKWKVFQISHLHRIDVLPHQPEPGREPAENKRFYVLHFARSRGFVPCEREPLVPIPCTNLLLHNQFVFVFDGEGVVLLHIIHHFFELPLILIDSGIRVILVFDD